MAVTAEKAVRDYLVALHHPENLRDETRINELSQRLEQTDDPLERLQLRAELAQAQAPDTDALEGNFVAHAKSWADEHGISAKAFEQEGVPRDVLRRAGLDGGRRARTARRSTQTRRPRVSREDVDKAIPPRKQFTIADVAASSGASTATVRKVVNEMVTAGQLEEVGTAEGHTGPGRAPTVYRRSRK